jgi:AraC-like DNA-binding protein
VDRDERDTLERLAREVGMSRSSFAQWFTMYVHMPPMQYLGRWRLQLPDRLLEAGTTSVGQAAATAGYQSEASFNRSDEAPQPSSGADPDLLFHAAVVVNGSHFVG